MGTRRVELQAVPALHQLPAQLREIAEHAHAGGVFVALALKLAEFGRAYRLRLHERGDAFLVAGHLSVKHLPRKAEETSSCQALEAGFQRDDHPAAAAPSSMIAGTGGTHCAEPFARSLDRHSKWRVPVATPMVSVRPSMANMYHEIRPAVIPGPTNRRIQSSS